MSEHHHLDESHDNNLSKFNELVSKYHDPKIASAVYRDGASFELLVQMLMEASKKTGDIDIENSCNEIYKLFEDKHGKITHVYVCEEDYAAAVLTDYPKFFTEYKLGGKPTLESLLIKIDYLAIEADRLLKGRDLEKCTTMIYSVAKKTLRLLDSEVDCENSKTVRKTVDLIEEQLQIATQYHERAARLRAQLDYFLGTLMGIAILVLFVIVLAFLNTRVEVMEFASSSFYNILLCGGIGAMVSVMSRMSAKKCILDYEAQSITIRLLGIFRPILGGVFAIILYALLESNLITSSFIPSGPNEKALFYLIVGFLAGFSERLVPDMLDIAGNKLLGQTENHLPETIH